MDAYVDNPLLGLLDHRIPLGVIGLDRQGRVVSMNYAARVMLDERDGLVLVQGRPVASREPEARELRRLIAGTCTRVGGPEGAGGAVRIARSAPRSPVTVFVAPLRSPSIGRGVAMPAALMFISDPEREPLRLEEMLKRLYGLTRSEAAVTLLVLDGMRVEDIARRRGTSLNTARTHIKRVLGKVGVQSQVDLVRMLLSGPVAAATAPPAGANGNGSCLPGMNGHALDGVLQRFAP